MYMSRMPVGPGVGANVFPRTANSWLIWTVMGNDVVQPRTLDPPYLILK
jgi:hypothetical protein